MMQGQINPSHLASQVPPSNCPEHGAHCPMNQISDILGSNLQDILTGFIKKSEDGARLTLQKGRSGFTVQVVGPVRRGGERGLPDRSVYQAPANS